jgi:hypothetical protein
MGYIDGAKGLEPGLSVHLTGSYLAHKEQVSVGTGKSSAVDTVEKGLGYLTLKYLDNVFSIGASDMSSAEIQSRREDTILERHLPNRCWERNMVM